jgi:hypothetical protein
MSFLLGDRYVPWRMRRSETKGEVSMTNPVQAELRVQISGRTDDEIVALVREALPEASRPSWTRPWPA